jgi:formiminoglutamate deiminase
MTGLFCDWALLPGGWAANVRIETDGEGRIAKVLRDARALPGDRRLADRLLIPAPGNLHSHAFQRAMAGHAERKESGEDSFWTWRETMYAFLARLTPDDVQAIAAYAYMEMLEAGYAAVGEFHYLHHAPDGSAYDDPAEMAHRIAAAAEESGIGLTLLPVLYAQGGVDGAPLSARQRRFGCDADRFAALVDLIRLPAVDSTLGVAAHSLRAVPADLLAELPQLRPSGPVHIHIAEQTAEVEAVEAAYGARPVAWLLDNAQVDDRWCAVHATHMTAEETLGLARSGAVAGLCPLTEADLGDGIFNGAEYIGAGGAYGIGSDSHIRIGLTEELRVLEYSQRLRDRRRCILRGDAGSVGDAMLQAAAAGGAQALGRGSGRIEVGARADLAALDADAILPFVPGPEQWLDHWIFVAGDKAVREVWSAGRLVVEHGRHLKRGLIAQAFRETLAGLMESA